MSSDVSSERSVDVAIARVARRAGAAEARGAAGWIVVAGPVVIHTGGGPALASLVRDGYVSGLLAGNALAVHDIESSLFGTSLGIALDTGKAVFEGHRNHIRAINAVFAHGSMEGGCGSGRREERGHARMHRLPGCPSFWRVPCAMTDRCLKPSVDMLAAQRAYAALAAGGHHGDHALHDAALHRHGKHDPRLGAQRYALTSTPRS